MSISGFFIGLVAGIGFIMPFIFPYLAWLNWINIAFSITGLFISYLGYIRGRHRLLAVAGIILNGMILIISCLTLP